MDRLDDRPHHPFTFTSFNCFSEFFERDPLVNGQGIASDMIETDLDVKLIFFELICIDLDVFQVRFIIPFITISFVWYSSTSTGATHGIGIECVGTIHSTRSGFSVEVTALRDEIQEFITVFINISVLALIH